MGDLTLEEIVGKVDELPALPYVTYRVLQLTSDPKTTIPELSAAIAADQVLTAKALRMANSVFYGYARRISSIDDALIILGFNTVRDLVLAASVYNVLDRELPGYFLSKGDLWRHSITTALLSRLLARKLEVPLAEEAFTAGLLHDIGKIILNNYMTDKFTKVIDWVEKENVPFMEAENTILGFDHAIVGARVAAKWNLPDQLVEAIANHHHPGKALTNPKLCSIVHVADAASMSMGIGLGGDGMLYPFDGFAVSELNLTTEIIDDSISHMADAMLDSETLLGVVD